MGYIAIAGTSNTRQFDVHARIVREVPARTRGPGETVNRKRVRPGKGGKTRAPVPLHTTAHKDCNVGKNINDAAENIRKIADIRVASYPGLDLDNITDKICYAGPYADKTVKQYLETICLDSQFSGTLAFIFLCNDEKFLKRQAQKEESSEREAVQKYLEFLGNFFASVRNFHKVKFVLISTALHRKNDFTPQNKNFLDFKKRFNSCFVKKQAKKSYELCVNGRYVPYQVLDMSQFLPPDEMSSDKYYCGQERYKVHIKAEYMEKVLVEIKNLHLKRYKNLRRGSKFDLFRLFCQINIH